eukprot:scaffold16650_cov38-Cyclotella_meneghiniana.AAC.1
MSSNDESINHDNVEDDDDAVNNKPVAEDDNEANDDGEDSNSNDDPYDISSMSEEEEEESTIHGSPSFEHVKSNSAVMSTPPRKSSNENDNPSDIPELNTSPSFPPSPFPALPPQLNSISNQSGYTNTNSNNMNMNNNNSSNSINMSPRFKPPISPAGSNSSLGSPTARSNYASSSNTLQNQQSTNNMNMPRFYDSEEDGPASLVFVESGSTTLGIKESSGIIVPLSPQHSVTNTNNNATATTSSSSHQYSRFFGEKSSKVPSISLSKNNNNTNTTTSHPSALLPYPQRRKMAIMGEGGSTTLEENIGHHPYLDNHNGMNVSSSLSLVDNKKPPTAPLSSPSTQQQQQQQQQLMMMNHKQSMAEKYKVPPIPVFRGSANHTVNHVSNEPMNNNMHQHHHHQHYSSSPPDRVARASSPMDYNPHNIRPPLAHYSTNSTGGGGSSANSNTMKQQQQQQQQRQQVINCPPPPPPPASPKDSPETSSFHIRCNSQTSISSLGSNAVDSVKGGGNTQTMNMMYKQFPQGYGVGGGGYTNNAHMNTMMTPYGYNMHPHPMAYPNIQQQQQQPPPKSNSGVAGFDNLNALDRDIATFLHGERIAAATAQTKNNGNNNNKGSKPTTVPKNHLYWNGYPQGVVPPMWQGHNNPYQQQQPQQQPPTPYNNNTPEPPPPPLTTVPNMELRRVRLPSISDDDWAEELEKINQEDYEDDVDDLVDGNRVKRQDRPNKKEWEFQMRQQQQQQQHQNMYNSQNNPHPSAAHNLYPNIQ